MHSSILSHLVLRFAQHPENLATEALAYVLQSSQSAAASLSYLLRRICPDSGAEHLYFNAQHTTEDGGRPDLVGRDSTGHVRFFLEAKFWAGLMDRQPVGYLKQLPAPGVLLFVAPERRLALLWQELEGRLERAGYELTTVDGANCYAVRTAGRTVALVSWRALLEQMHGSLEAAGDFAVASDLRQLMALCERMDAEAFVPLTPEELNPTIGKRVLQYCQLVDDVTDRLVARGASSVRSARHRRQGVVRPLPSHGELWDLPSLFPRWLGRVGPLSDLADHQKGWK